MRELERPSRFVIVREMAVLIPVQNRAHLRHARANIDALALLSFVSRSL
jgi:hypothetical protein